MADNLTIQGPNILTSDQILNATVPLVYEARQGTCFRVRTIPPRVIPVVPTVTTTSATAVVSGSSVVTASIVSTGGANPTVRGICWSVNPAPTISLTTKTVENGSFSIGSFTATATGIAQQVYVRAYATNSAGTGYGNEIIITPGYRYWRWRITNVRNFSLANSVQASEFKFQIGGVDQSMIGVTVSNPSGNNPSGEDPSKLVDNSLSTKWLDFNIKSFGYSNFVFDFGVGQSRSFNGYRWATANDEIDRDPITWTIEASNNNSTWTVLHTVTNFTPTSARNTWQTAQAF